MRVGQVINQVKKRLKWLKPIILIHILKVIVKILGISQEGVNLLNAKSTQLTGINAFKSDCFLHFSTRNKWSQIITSLT